MWHWHIDVECASRIQDIQMRMLASKWIWRFWCSLVLRCFEKQQVVMLHRAAPCTNHHESRVESGERLSLAQSDFWSTFWLSLMWDFASLTVLSLSATFRCWAWTVRLYRESPCHYFSRTQASWMMSTISMFTVCGYRQSNHMEHCAYEIELVWRLHFSFLLLDSKLAALAEMVDFDSWL